MSLVDELRIKREANVVFRPLERWRQRVEGGASPWFTRLLAYACHAEGKSRPTKKFIRETGVIIDEIGSDVVRDNLLSWLGSYDLSPPSGWEYGSFSAEGHLASAEREILRGVMWAAQGIIDDALCSAMADFAVRCFKKIPDYGPASSKLGNAAVLYLSVVPGTRGVSALARVAAQVRYPSAKKQISRVLDEAAQRAGVSRDELEEMSVPTFGLVDGEEVFEIAGYTATLTLGTTDVSLSWMNAAGEALRNEPKAARDQAGDEVKALKRHKKELTQTAAAQVARLERLWLRASSISIGNLRQRYLHHPLVGHYARRLLWSIEDGGTETCALYRDDQFVSLGQAIAVSESATARLWHPISSTSTEEVAVWRDWLAELGITQPFAQIYRDAYRPGQEVVDDRFSGHILLQTAVRSQCQRRGWSYKLQGHWDGDNSPTLVISEHELEVVFGADPAPHTTDDFSFQYLVSGGVHFFKRATHRGYAPMPAAPSSIDPIVFSEAMRDVSQIIASCTIAVDEGFDATSWDASFGDYWMRGAWGDLALAAQMRADVLRDALARTVLRDRAAIEDRWLVIRADDLEHRIHVGSGLVEGSDGQPREVRLSAKAKRAAAEVFLPDEGDAMVRKILAKALALAG